MTDAKYVIAERDDGYAIVHQTFAVVSTYPTLKEARAAYVRGAYGAGVTTDNPNIKTQAEIVADLINRAEKLETSARTARHTKHNRICLQLAARVLRVAALQNSPAYDGKQDDTAEEITAE